MTLHVDGEEIAARPGDTVAVALFAAGERVLSRSIKYHRPRGLFCLNGHCGACLMRIDGRPNVKACQTPCTDGMKVERQNAFPSGRFDLLGAADFFFPKGMDHHTMMTSPRPLNAVMQKVVRQLAGLGHLPDAPGNGQAPPLPHKRARHVDVAIVGGGPAGLEAAARLGRTGRSVLLVDEQDRLGGSYLADPRFGLEAADRAIAEAQAAGAELLPRATALGYYAEDVPRPGAAPGLLAVHVEGRGLLKLTAERYVYATGAYDQNALFADNDRPGVMSARAVGRLLVRFGVKPAERPVVLGGGPYAQALAEALEGVGAKVARVDGTQARACAAHGHAWVRGLEVLDAGQKKTRRIACDLVAVAALPAPASEVPRQHGVEVAFRPEAGGFACVVDGDGESGVGGVFCAGDVTGFRGPAEARAHGARVAAAVEASLGGRP